LLATTVHLIGEQLGFYHTGLFFIDPAGEWAVLQAASSAGGQRMLERGHRLRVGAQGIVGNVAARGAPRIALDVGQDAIFFDNPDLPETHSEMALPLRARGQVIGVLDVQSTEREAFTQEDISVLQTLADQVALAISNARLFSEVQENLAAQQRAYGALTGEAWRTLLAQEGELGFIKQGNVVSPFVAELVDEVVQAAKTGALVQYNSVDGAHPTALAVPIKSGDQVIAVLDAHLPAGAATWTPDQVTLLQLLSEQVSQAMERARLHQDTQRRAARERVLREATTRIRSSSDPETVLQVLLKEVGALLHRSAFVRLISPEQLAPVPGEPALQPDVDHAATEKPGEGGE
jgi:GAF domain-containing protein